MQYQLIGVSTEMGETFPGDLPRQAMMSLSKMQSCLPKSAMQRTKVEQMRELIQNAEKDAEAQTESITFYRDQFRAQMRAAYTLSEKPRKSMRRQSRSRSPSLENRSRWSKSTHVEDQQPKPVPDAMSLDHRHSTGRRPRQGALVTHRSSPLRTRSRRSGGSRSPMSKGSNASKEIEARVEVEEALANAVDKELLSLAIESRPSQHATNAFTTLKDMQKGGSGLHEKRIVRPTKPAFVFAPEGGLKRRSRPHGDAVAPAFGMHMLKKGVQRKPEVEKKEGPKHAKEDLAAELKRKVARAKSVYHEDRL